MRMQLTDYLNICHEQGDLLEVDAPVTTDQEIAAISRREFDNRDGGKVLLFNSPSPGKFRVASNLFGSEARMASILRSGSLADFEKKVGSYLKRSDVHVEQGNLSFNPPLHTVEESDPFIESCQLTDIPALKSWPQENRPYFSLALTMTCHPETGQQNVGLYRVQIIDDNTLAINLSKSSGAQRHLHAAAELGRSLPICLVLGCDPLLMWAAAAPLPATLDEFVFCRHFFEEDFHQIQTAKLPFPVPASAELVINGTLTAGDVGQEGPFGNHTGAYVTREDCPLMRVSSIHHRPEAIIPVTVVGPPPSENIWLAATNEILIRQILKQQHSEITHIAMPVMTIFHGVVIISVSATTQQQVKQLIAALWNSGPLQRARLMVVVDDLIDPAYFERCWWWVINRLDKLRVYQNNQRTAVDASGIDIGTMVEENRAIGELIKNRQEESGYYPL